MIDENLYDSLDASIRTRVLRDVKSLDVLRQMARQLRASQDQLSAHLGDFDIFAVDGGNNRFNIEPFSVQVVRVSDSDGHSYCTDVITSGTTAEQLTSEQFGFGSEPVSALGEMMSSVGVSQIGSLSQMTNVEHGDLGPLYREMVEWAALYHLVCREVDRRLDGQVKRDAVIVADGPLRSKIFDRSTLKRLGSAISEKILSLGTNGPRVHLAGVTKHSKILQKYMLGMRLENVLRDPHPVYVEISREAELDAYRWPNYARGDTDDTEYDATFLKGSLYFAKFGPHPDDPIWAVDVFEPHSDCVQEALSMLCYDASCGFPVPYYPMSLQKAHGYAAVSGFDSVMLQDLVWSSVRDALGNEGVVVDYEILRDRDPSVRRY